MKYALANQKYEEAMKCIKTLESEGKILTAEAQKQLSRAKKVRMKLKYHHGKECFWEFGPEGKDIPLDESDGEGWVSPKPSPSIEGSDAGTAVEIPPLVLGSGDEKTQGWSEYTKPMTRAMSVYMVTQTVIGNKATIIQGVDPVQMEVQMPVDVVQAGVNETTRGKTLREKRKRKSVRDATGPSNAVDQDATDRLDRQKLRKVAKPSAAVPTTDMPNDSPCDQCAQAGILCFAQIKNDQPLKSCIHCREIKKRCLWAGADKKPETKDVANVVGSRARTKRKAATEADERVLQMMRSTASPSPEELFDENPRPTKRARTIPRGSK